MSIPEQTFTYTQQNHLRCPLEVPLRNQGSRLRHFWQRLQQINSPQGAQAPLRSGDQPTQPFFLLDFASLITEKSLIKSTLKGFRVWFNQVVKNRDEKYSCWWWPNSTLDADEKLICGVCGKIYHCPETYRKHLQSHTYVWPCTLCERTFSWQFSLRSHMETTHSQTRGFACGSCASAFKLKGHLRRHCQNTGHLFLLSK